MSAGSVLPRDPQRLGVVEIHRDLAAGDRLHALLGEFLGNLQGAEQVVDVRDRQRRLRVGQRQLQQLADGNCALTQRKRGMEVKMDKADGGDGLFLHPSSHRPFQSAIF